MRHRKNSAKLSMMPSHRKATLRNMVRSLIKYQKIETLLSRAKEARRLTEQMITLSKVDTVHSRRMAYVVLADRDLVGELFNKVGPLFKNRIGGYTRIIPLGFRRGDGAPMAILELTEKSVIDKLPKEKKGKSKAGETAESVLKKSDAKVKDPGKPGAEKHAKSEAAGTEQAVAKSEEHRKEPKKISKSKPTLAEEKRSERGKTEDKKMGDKKMFMKNLRGFFRRKGDM